MIFRLLLLFTIVPAIELVILLQVHHLVASRFGTLVGLLVTVGTIVITGVTGAALARQQGMDVLRQLREQMQQGELPGQALADGVLVLIGAALLLTPGFLTDMVGFSLLIPASRKFYRERLMEWMRNRVRLHRSGGSEVFVVDAVDPHDKERS